MRNCIIVAALCVMTLTPAAHARQPNSMAVRRLDPALDALNYARRQARTDKDRLQLYRRRGVGAARRGRLRRGQIDAASSLGGVGRSLASSRRRQHGGAQGPFFHDDQRNNSDDQEENRDRKDVAESARKVIDRDTVGNTDDR
jgi:hypothetical protein